MKNEPMNQNMEEYFEKTPDSVKSSENADLDMEKLRNLYHKNTDIKTKEQKLFEYANTVANVGLHQEWAHTVNPKEKALETNRKEIEFLTKATDAIKKDITKIKTELFNVGITPVTKSQMKETLANLEKGYVELKRLKDLEVAKTYMIENADYPEPENPYKNINKN